MSENKTKPTDVDVDSYLNEVTPDRRRTDAIALNGLFKEVTGWAPRMWGGSIIGYGQYHYVYDSGREGDFLATGFAPRKANMVVYIMPGYAAFDDILGRLGPHKLGKSCLYLGALSKIDMTVLGELIVAGLDDLKTRWTVQAS